VQTRNVPLNTPQCTQTMEEESIKDICLSDDSDGSSGAFDGEITPCETKKSLSKTQNPKPTTKKKKKTTKKKKKRISLQKCLFDIGLLIYFLPPRVFDASPL
jgi:hypothetical protein